MDIKRQFIHINDLPKLYEDAANHVRIMEMERRLRENVEKFAKEQIGNFAGGTPFRESIYYPPSMKKQKWPPLVIINVDITT